MKIKDIINNKKVTVSFEVFPPKQWDKIANTKKIVEEMVKDKPSFMSVTYGAAGTTSGFTTEIANAIKEGGVEPLSHLTCLTSTKEKIDSVLDELEANGIENVLALRGDIPKDFEMGENQYFHHAFELSNASLPAKFNKIMERFGENPDAMKQAGIVYATEQIIDLMANGVNNIHIYTMNKPDVAHQIMEGLSAIINE